MEGATPQAAAEPAAGPRGGSDSGPTLIIVADDYGYAPSYDEGILQAARAGAVDAVSAMVLRDPEAEPLLATGVEVGLHLEPLSAAPLARQLERFTQLFGRPPSHLDGHHNCHAARGRTALSVARLGRRLGARVRSVSPRHRRLLRRLGVRTPDRLVGRLTEDESAMPEEIARWLEGSPPGGVTEWVVHPGRSDARTGSRYDRGREEDLRLVLRLADVERLASARRA
jgi:predicted glycoside hydrolase/deacetylase ChbG (UPF0249 family)